MTTATINDDAATARQQRATDISLEQLGEIRIASPCHMRWEDLDGDGNIRHCRECRLHVHDFASMTPAEIAEVVAGPRSQASHRARRAIAAALLLPESGNTILVGRSARSNEDVTFRHANPADLWFHALGLPGSHVVLKKTSNTAFSDEEIRRAAGLAAHFSKGRRATAVEVMFTERKYVTKIKGAPPGLVRVKKHETVRVAPTPPDRPS